MTWFDEHDRFPAWLPVEAIEWMPLAEFSPEHRQAIRDAVEAPTPPPRFIELGVDRATGRAMLTIESRAWWEWHWARDLDPDSVRRKLPKRLRDQVIERDGYICGLCGDDVAEDDIHIDHIKPWSLGGSDEPDNLQVAHSLCNIKKGARI